MHKWRRLPRPRRVVRVGGRRWPRKGRRRRCGRSQLAEVGEPRRVVSGWRAGAVHKCGRLPRPRRVVRVGGRGGKGHHRERGGRGGTQRRRVHPLLCALRALRGAFVFGRRRRRGGAQVAEVGEPRRVVSGWRARSAHNWRRLPRPPRLVSDDGRRWPLQGPNRRRGDAQVAEVGEPRRVVSGWRPRTAPRRPRSAHKWRAVAPTTATCERRRASVAAARPESPPRRCTSRGGW